MAEKPKRPLDPEIAESPVYWFSVLERARQIGDFERAKLASTELARLGVRVQYRDPHGARERGGTQ